MQSLILSAESQSRHPVAQSLRQEWGLVEQNKSKNIHIVGVKNNPGQGVEATYVLDSESHTISIQKAKNSEHSSGLIEVVVTIDSMPKAYLFFEEKIREKTSRFVQHLYDLKYDTYILTGDLKNRALEFSKKFKIPAFRVFSEQTPEMKEAVIQSHNPTLYIGDGLNDLLALKAAHVSYAIEGQFDVTLSVADVYAPQKGPEGILFLVDLSRQIQKAVHGNLFFALVYNVVAGGLALSGQMSPLLAAVLMPVSSTLILTHTMWRLR
jgi:P-type E1-E2 ATPase